MTASALLRIVWTGGDARPPLIDLAGSAARFGFFLGDVTQQNVAQRH